MNKQLLLRNAQRKIAENRLNAEDKCENILKILRSNPQFTEIEQGLRQAEIDYANGSDSDKKQAEARIKDFQQQQKKFLAQLKLTERDLKPQYSCDLCNDRGYVDGYVCSCLQEELRKQIIAESNVTNRNFTFDTSTETDKHNLIVYKMAQEICLSGESNILITGNTGSGKTYLLTACANLCADNSKSVLFVTAYTLNGMLLDAHLSDVATNQAITDSIVDVDVLLIDDLGTEIVYKNVTAEYFFSVLNERIARKKQTFITTNLTLRDIRERYDERIFSRLVDQSTTFVAELTGADKRIKKV